MEENILEQVPGFKLHKKRTITICAFLTGPLVAGYLIAENFNQLNETRNATKTWIYTILGTIALFYGIAFVPAFEKVPNILFPVIYTSIASYVIQRYQEPKIKLHQEKGGQFFPVWRAVLASVISLAITIAFIFLILLISSPDIFQ